MSYAEHGTRIFFTGKIQTGHGDELVVEKHSECRLKMQDSWTDHRAWSPNQLECFRYFREFTENQPICEKIAQSNVTVNVMMDVDMKSELEFLRHELAKYKALELTPKQKKQLGQADLGDVFSKGDWSLIDCIVQQIQKFRGYKEALLGKVMDSAVKIEEIDDEEEEKEEDNETPSYSESLDSERHQKSVKHGDKIEEKSSTESSNTISKDSSTLSQSTSSCSKLEINKNNETSSSCGMARSDRDDGRFDFEDKSKFIIDNDNDDDDDEDDNDRSSTISSNASESPTLDTPSIASERAHIIKTESMIIALENDLSAKEAELEELRDLSMNFRSTLQDRDMQINHLQEHLAETQFQLRELIDQRDFELDEWKKKLSHGRNLIDQVNRKLEEKRQQCAVQEQEIKDLKNGANNLEPLRAERDSLAKKLDEVSKLVKDAGNYGGGLEGMKAMIRERDELIDLKKNFELHCLDQEDEIDRLSKLIHRMQDENENQRIEMNGIIEDLKIELEKKNRKIAHYQDEMASLVRQSEEKVIYEQTLHPVELSDEILDRALVCYLKRSKEKVNELSADLKGAGDEVGRGKNQVESLRKEMEEKSRNFRDQMNQKSNEAKFYLDLYEQCKQKLEDHMKENEDLRTSKYQFLNDAELVNDLTKTIHEKDLKVTALHKEHYNLTNEIKNLNGKLAARTQQIVELEHEKENLLHKINSTAIEVEAKNSKIDALREENLKIAEKLKNNENKVAALLEEMQSIRYKDDEINQISLLQKEIDKFSKEKRKLEDTITNLHNEFENYRKANKKLNDNLSNILSQRETLESKISLIKEDISRLSSDLKDNIFSEGHLMHLPKKICSSIGILKERLKLTELHDYRDREFVDNVYEDVKNHHNENNFMNSDLNYMENNIRADDTDVHKIKNKIGQINDELNSKDQIIKSLTQENRDLSLKMDAERIMHQNKLEKLKLHYKASLKACYEDTNRTMKRLEAQHLETECGFINDNFLSPLKMKFNNQLSASAYADRLTLEKNVEDFSKVTVENNATEERRNVIFFKPNNENKSKQRYIYEDSSKRSDENSTCKQFIRNCSERQNNDSS